MEKGQHVKPSSPERRLMYSIADLRPYQPLVLKQQVIVAPVKKEQKGAGGLKSDTEERHSTPK